MAVVLDVVLDALPAGAITTGSLSGRPPGCSAASLVSLLRPRDQDDFSERVSPTPTQNRSSGSS